MLPGWGAHGCVNRPPPPATGGQPSLASPPMFATPVSTVPPPFLLVGLAAIFEAPVCVGSPSFLLLIFRGAGRWHSGTDSPPPATQIPMPLPHPPVAGEAGMASAFLPDGIAGLPGLPRHEVPPPLRHLILERVFSLVARAAQPLPISLVLPGMS